jgi:uncharacterized protein
MSPPAFRFDLGDHQLIYAPLDDLAAVLSRNDCARLVGTTELTGDLARLRTLLLAATNSPRPPSGDLAPEILGLITTRRCTMACTYCEFGTDSDEPAELSTELAFAAIDDFAQRAAARGHPRLPIHLFGGEPFSAWRLVQRIVARGRAVAAELGLEPFFEATTNGLYSPERARWIADNLHRVVLSVDGLPELHDTTRPDRSGRPTSSRVAATARVLSLGTVDLCLRLCVSAAGVGQLEASLRHLLHDLELLPIAIAVEPVRSLKPSTAHPDRSPPEPAAFVEAFLGCLDLCEERGVLLQLSGADLGAKVVSFCPVGNDGFIVHPDGTVASCYLPREQWRHRGLTLDYGRIEAGRGLVVDNQRLASARSVGAPTYAACRSCFCRWHCAGGCHVYRANGANDPQWCTMVRAISLGLLLRQVGLGGVQLPLTVHEQLVELPAAEAQE